MSVLFSNQSSLIYDDPIKTTTVMDKSGIDRCKLILGFMMNLALERFVASKLKLFECTRFNFAKGNLLTFLQLFSTSSIFRYVSQGKKLANFTSVKNPNYYSIIILSQCHGFLYLWDVTKARVTTYLGYGLGYHVLLHVLPVECSPLSFTFYYKPTLENCLLDSKGRNQIKIGEKLTRCNLKNSL